MGLSRMVGLLLVGVVVAGAVALLVFRLFGVNSQDDVRPPICHNASGGIVSCDLTPEVLLWPTFGIVLLVLVIGQVVRSRRR